MGLRTVWALGMSDVRPDPDGFQQYSKEYSGDALYKKIIADAEDQLHRLSCFVAGTLVHTKEGLRPIDKIKAGDYVLSKSESGEGEVSYQRVTRTYEHEDREVYFAAWTVEDLVVPRIYPVDHSKLESDYVVVTGEHPF